MSSPARQVQGIAVPLTAGELGRTADKPKPNTAGLKPFPKGKSGNPGGRPKGSKHKLSERFIAAMCEDFEQHGVATIAKVRKARPHDYLKIVASLLPKQVDIRKNPLEDLTDEQLEEAIAILLKLEDPDAS